MGIDSRKNLDYRPCPCPAKHVIPTSLVLSLGIAGAAFLIISYLALRRCASRRRTSPTNREEFAGGPDIDIAIDHPVWYIRTTGLPQAAIESIQQFTFKKKKGSTSTPSSCSDCSVCLSEFQDGESLRLLPKCTHAFHVPCIDTWLRSHTNCPLCRSPVEPMPMPMPMPMEAVRRSVSLSLMLKPGRLFGPIDPSP